MIKTKLVILSIVAALGLNLAAIMPNALASHSSSPAACEGDGLYDGKNNPFSQKLYDMCGDTYYDAFIEGCMSVDNSRDVCESATDAGDNGGNDDSNSNSDSSDESDEDIQYCDGQNAPQYPDSCYDRNDLPEDSGYDDDDKTANCGGESCTDDEKEDSWTDEDEGVPLG